MLGRKAAKGPERQLSLTAFFTPQAAGKRKFGSTGIGTGTSERPRKKGRVKENVLLPLSPVSSPRRGTSHAVSRNKDHQPREPEEDEYATPVQTKRHDDVKKAGCSRTSSVDSLRLRLPLSPRRRRNPSSATDKQRLPAAALPTPPPTHQFVPKRTLPPFVSDDSDDIPDSTPTPMPNKAHVPTPRTPPRTSKGKQRAVSDSPIDLCSPELTSPLTSLPPSPEPATIQRNATTFEDPGDEIVPSSQTQILEWNPFLDEPPQPKSDEFVFKQPLLPASRARLSTLGHGSPSSTSFRSPSRRVKLPPPLKTRGLTTSPARSPSTSSRGSSQIVPTSQTDEEELVIGSTSLSPMRRRREQMKNFAFQFNWDDQHGRNRSGDSDEIVPTSQSDERELVIPSPRMNALDLSKPDSNKPPLLFGDIFPPVSTAGPRTPPKGRASASPRIGLFTSPKVHKVTFADVDLTEPPRTPERHPPRAAASYAPASPYDDSIQSSQTVPESALTPPRPYWKPRTGPVTRPESPRDRTPEPYIESSVTEPESSQWIYPSQLPSHSQQRRERGLHPIEHTPPPVDESQTQPESSQWRVPTQGPSRSQQRRQLGLPPLEPDPAPEDESQTQPESSQWRDPSQLPSHSQQRRMKGLPIPVKDESQTQPESSQWRDPSQLPSHSQQRRMKGLPIPDEDRVPVDSSQTEPESSQWRVPTQLPSHSQQRRMKGLPEPKPVEKRVPEPPRKGKQRWRPVGGLPDDEIVPSQELGSLPYADEESQYHFDFDQPAQPQEAHDTMYPPSFDEDDVEDETVTIRVSKRKFGFMIRWAREKDGGDPSNVSGSPPSIPSDYEASNNGSQIDLDVSPSMQEYLNEESQSMEDP